MRKVKQLCRHTMGRVSLPYYKLATYQKTFNIFAKNFRHMPKYFTTIKPFTAETYVSQKKASTQSIEADSTLMDKKGLLNLLPQNAPKTDGPVLGDFEKVNAGNFVHALNIPAHEIEFAKFSVSDIETVCSEAIDEFEMFEAKKIKNTRRVKEGKETELAHQNVRKLTSTMKVMTYEDILKVRRSLLGVSPALI